MDREKTFVRALTGEIKMRLSERKRLDTLYFGGGTPSLLSDESWMEIFSAFRQHAEIFTESEITIEANPASITVAAAKFWRGIGVNRVSVGVQSLNGDILLYLNRIHTSENALDAVRILNETGMDNVNADLIYSIPGQRTMDVIDAIDRLSPWIDHLSAYALTIVPGTPFARRGVTLPDSDVVADQYERIVDRAAAAGLERYEVSNFSRHGAESRHNLNTWRYGACVALGPSAAGFDGSRRYKNIADFLKYAKAIQSGELPESESEEADPSTAFWDRLMLGLRTREGVRLSPDERAGLAAIADSAGLGDHLEWTENGARLKPDKIVLLDEILTRLRVAAPCR